VLVVLAAFPGVASADAGDVGYQGRPYLGAGGSPTGLKRAESILWWNDGSWWANMWDTASADFHIFRLDEATQTWIDTGVAIDTRSSTHADVLWDGAHLYVASHAYPSDGQPAVSGFPSRLYRFSYDPLTQTYSRDAGFPVLINNMKTETLVIDKDSTGKLWATWQQDNQIYVNRTIGDDSTWGTPFPLPAAGSSVTVDDNSSVIAFGGTRVGVMWSNQTTGGDAMYFSVHADGDADTTWSISRSAIQGSGSADDHINLKSLQADQDGRIYAAVKTSFTNSAAPLLMLLVRDPATGGWESYPVARVSDCPNRPIVMIDEENRVLHAFATYPAPPAHTCTSSGGAIYEKTSPLDNISFPSGYGTPVMLDADSPYMQNVTSSKQNVNSTTGLATLAINSNTGVYWHAFETIPPARAPVPPTAGFTATPTSGTAPLTVSFSDTSTGTPSAWSWSFGDGATATEQHPTHTYTTAGTYAVSLTVSNTAGSDTVTKQDYITVTLPPPDFGLTVTPASRTLVRPGRTTYDVTLTSTHGFSAPVELSVGGLPSGVTASLSPNPVHVAGTGTSTLTVDASATAKLGTANLTITGTSGTLTHRATANLQIKRK
jgi:PKD repeat protein